MPNSQSDGANAAKRFGGKDSLRPVTIKQLHDAHHPHADAEHFMIDDAETMQITLVAQIRNISLQATNQTYKMDDGTGTIEAKIWVDSDLVNNPDDPMNKNRDKLQEGSYARVYGRLKEFNNKRHVGANVIRPITDLNEIQYHLLEATYVHLATTRGPANALQAKSGSNGTTANGGYGGDSGDTQLPASISQRARKVFQCIKAAPQQQEGTHAQSIASQLGMDMGEVMKASDELVGYGIIYTTVDEHTWAIL